MYDRLVVFKKKYKTTRVPAEWKEDPKFGRWVSRQREICKDRGRIELLNVIDFECRLLERPE
jgi:hypothetical protein